VSIIVFSMAVEARQFQPRPPQNPITSHSLLPETTRSTTNTFSVPTRACRRLWHPLPAARISPILGRVLYLSACFKPFHFPNLPTARAIRTPSARHHVNGKTRGRCTGSIPPTRSVTRWGITRQLGPPPAVHSARFPRTTLWASVRPKLLLRGPAGTSPSPTRLVLSSWSQRR